MSLPPVTKYNSSAVTQVILPRCLEKVIDSDDLALINSTLPTVVPAARVEELTIVTIPVSQSLKDPFHCLSEIEIG
mgnify:CR=1 FL=1